MQLILISGTRARARSVTLGPKQCLLALLAVLFAVFVAACVICYIISQTGLLHYFPSLESGLLSRNVQAFREDEQRRQENIDSMAARIGNMQAKLLQIDMMGRHLKEAVGIDENHSDHVSDMDKNVPQGGPMISIGAKDSEAELQVMIDQLALEINKRQDILVYIEDHLVSDSVREQLFPGQVPLESVYMTSRFGTRFDPFTRRVSRHNGVDFAVPVGSEILSAAGGIVRRSEYHPQYGYMVDIDHGNGLSTRYAHCSKLFVKKGDFVKRGVKIAASGNTGRSTGPHLHFEVRKNGAAVNPLLFLRSNVRHQDKQLARR